MTLEEFMEFVVSCDSFEVLKIRTNQLLKENKLIKQGLQPKRKETR